MQRGFTPAEMVVVDGVRRYPAPSTVADKREDKKEPAKVVEAAPVEQKAREPRNKARRPADK